MSRRKKNAEEPQDPTWNVELQGESETLIVRDPMVVGDYEWGCHSHFANNMAAVTDSTQHLYHISQELYNAWDAHMRKVALQLPNPHSVRAEAFRFLLNYGDPLLQAVKKEVDKGFEEPQAYSNNDIRDWFCWLYRQFRSWKQDSVR